VHFVVVVVVVQVIVVDRSVQVLDLVLEVQHLEVKEALLLLVADVELLLDLELNTFNVIRWLDLVDIDQLPDQIHVSVPTLKDERVLVSDDRQRTHLL